MGTSLQVILETWAGAGEAPQKLLVQYDYYEKFLEHLNKSQYLTLGTIYRCINSEILSKLEKGDVLDFTDVPSSWTTRKDVANRFLIPDSVGNVILILHALEPIKAIYNDFNINDESEVVCAPMKLKILSKNVISSITYFDVQQLI